MGNLQNLLYLRVFNNRLKSYLQNLLDLFAWNNTFTTLPKTIGDIESLLLVDVRHNTLTDLPLSVSQWSKVEHLYLAGNPLCAELEIPSNLENAKGLCEQQCSVDCHSNMLDNGVCDDKEYTFFYTKHANPNVKPKPNSGCNTVACEYDKGDCPR